MSQIRCVELKHIGIALSVEKDICCKPPTAQMHSSYRTPPPPLVSLWTMFNRQSPPSSPGFQRCTWRSRDRRDRIRQRRRYRTRRSITAQVSNLSYLIEVGFLSNARHGGSMARKRVLNPSLHLTLNQRSGANIRHRAPPTPNSAQRWHCRCRERQQRC